jgi:hypothetical protein
MPDLETNNPISPTLATKVPTVSPLGYQTNAQMAALVTKADVGLSNVENFSRASMASTGPIADAIAAGGGMAGYLNVLAYGSAGAADFSIVVNAALAAARPLGFGVYIPNGTYTCLTAITGLSHGSFIVGENRYKTVLDFVGAAKTVNGIEVRADPTSHLHGTGSVSRAGVHNLYLKGHSTNGTSATGNGVMIVEEGDSHTSDWLELQNVEIRNWNVGFYSQDAAQTIALGTNIAYCDIGVSLNGGSNNTHRFSQCGFGRNRVGVVVNGGIGSVFTSCEFGLCTLTGYLIKAFALCKIENANWEGNLRDVTVEGSGNCSITNANSLRGIAAATEPLWVQAGGQLTLSQVGAAGGEEGVNLIKADSLAVVTITSSPSIMRLSNIGLATDTYDTLQEDTFGQKFVPHLIPTRYFTQINTNFPKVSTRGIIVRRVGLAGTTPDDILTCVADVGSPQTYSTQSLLNQTLEKKLMTATRVTASQVIKDQVLEQNSGSLLTFDIDADARWVKIRGGGTGGYQVNPPADAKIRWLNAEYSYISTKLNNFGCIEIHYETATRWIVTATSAESEFDGTL